MKFSDYWNNSHSKYGMGPITYDKWLDDYQDILSKCQTKILDLGCGTGNDTLYLVERGHKVISLDYSEVALKKIDSDIKEAETILHDISEPLPFPDSSFDVIIADLSLHYFDEQTTYKIMEEIKRILTKGGYLIARVNSTDDLNYGASGGVKIEDHYYYVEGYDKRFFDFDDVNKFFSVIGQVKAREAEMLRYEKPKKVIEVLTQKI